jgi:hypothetical protein
MDAVKVGSLEKIAYWLKNDATEYIQTYTTPLAFSGMILTDETEIPKPEPEPELEPEEPNEDPGNLDTKLSSGDCDTGRGRREL